MHLYHALTGVLALSGLLCIGVAVVAEPPPPQPRLSTVDGIDRSAPRPGPADRVEPASAMAQTVVVPVMQDSEPLALAIPAIDVQSAVRPLGLTAAGELEVPAPGPHYDEAGWFRYSPTPGSRGPAVIVGHIDSASEGPSVFFRLGSLRPDDRIHVTRADGSEAVFTVDDVRRYRKARFPSQLVYGDTDHAALRLITCGGPFDHASGRYRDNIVVLASLVRSTRSGRAKPPTGS